MALALLSSPTGFLQQPATPRAAAGARSAAATMATGTDFTLAILGDLHVRCCSMPPDPHSLLDARTNTLLRSRQAHSNLPSIPGSTS